LKTGIGLSTLDNIQIGVSESVFLDIEKEGFPALVYIDSCAEYLAPLAHHGPLASNVAPS
jgi:hypothetical protein